MQCEAKEPKHCHSGFTKKDAEKKNCCSSDKSCFLYNSVPAGSLQIVHPYELINIKEADLINERFNFP